MKIQSTQTSATDFVGDALVIGLWQDEELEGAAKSIDDASGGLLTRMLELEEISAKPLKISTLHGPTGIKTPIVITVGLGARSEFKPGMSYRAAGAASKCLASRARKSVAFYLEVDQLEHAIAGSMVGCVGQDLYQSKPSLHPFESVSWFTDNEIAIESGRSMGASINQARRLVNAPAGEIHPESFADECVRLGAENGFEVEVWAQEKLEDENCGALLAVARGSDKPGRMVIMRHMKGTPDQGTLAFVGKGVTFDSGGLSLKPSAGMLDMKCDMAGAASVVGAMVAIAKLNLPVNVIGLAGLAENMVSGDCFRLGDVLTARNGKTIEVHNTDAEGRLVLADTLNVAVTLGAEKIVDLATLTGACMVALGRDVSALMTNDQDWCDQVQQAAAGVGESVWQLPMFPEYGEHIKSKVADIKNVGDARWGGAITAGKFLEEFVDETTWVHVDIAGPSFRDSPKPWVDAGASGCFVSTLVEIAKLGVDS